MKEQIVYRINAASTAVGCGNINSDYLSLMNFLVVEKGISALWLVTGFGSMYMPSFDTTIGY